MIERFAAVCSKVGFYASGVFLVFIALHTLVEIALRGLFGISTLVHVEFVGYALASMTFLALGQTMRDGAHVRVNVVLAFLPQPARRALDALCVFVTAAAIGFAAWYVWFDIYRAYLRGYETDSIFPMPLWISRTGMLLGLLIFCITLIAQGIAIVFRGSLIQSQTPIE